MKFTIASEHRDFFRKQGSVEFEDLIQPIPLKEFSNSIEEALAERLAVAHEKLPWQNPEKLYMAGRDLWRTHTSLKKMVFHSGLVGIASEILEQKPLRYGYDQFFASIPSSSRFRDKGYEERDNTYLKMLRHDCTLEEMSSLQGISCGLMLCLHGESENKSTPKEEGDLMNVFPSRAGNGIYFSPKVMVDWKHLIEYPNHRYLLLVYTPATSVYFLQEGDPHTHALKRLGYSFGDKLSDKLHPILCR